MKATAMTVKEIQAALRNSGKWDVRSCVMVPNISWGLLWHEADFVSCSPAGRLTEVEIKRSWSDYKADFAKNHHHEDPKVTYFYYCVPESLVEKVASHLKEALWNRDTGLLYYTEDGRIVTKWDATRRSGSVGLSEKEMADLGRLGTLRYWNLLNEGLHHRQDKKIEELRAEISWLRAEFRAATGNDINDIL